MSHTMPQQWFDQQPTAFILFPTALEAVTISTAPNKDEYMRLVKTTMFHGPKLDITFMPVNKYAGRIYDEFKRTNLKGQSSAYNVLNSHVAYGDTSMLEKGSGCFQVVLDFGGAGSNRVVFFLLQANPLPSIIPYVDGESVRYVYKYETHVSKARDGNAGLRIDALISFTKRNNELPDQFEVEMFPYVLPSAAKPAAKSADKGKKPKK